jgi:hypothetical protein
MTTNAATVNADITALLRARHTLLWITTLDELRVERALVAACADAKFVTRFWDCATGLTDEIGTVIATIQDPSGVLDYITSRKERAVYVLRDLHAWLDPVVARKLRTLTRQLQGTAPNEARSIVLLTPNSEKARELPESTVIEYPLPDRAEVATILDTVIGALPAELRGNAAPNGTRDAAIDGALGLSAFQISNSYSRSLVTSRKVDPKLVTNEKKRVVAGIPGVTWYDPDPRGLDAIGGCGELKAWCLQRKAAFSPRAREYGLPTPKGVVLVGPPGTGKSLTAKCVGTAFRMPVLRLDLGGLLSKYLGESQGAIRRVLALAETVAPCVVWIDEIEKALAGASGDGGTDGGTAKDQLGTLLSWMQEKTAPVFVIATANDVRALPPELLRKGRFDELFFVDLPQAKEREEILAASLKASNREPSTIDLAEVARVTAGFVGAEIAALVPDALFAAFADGEREITTADLVRAAGSVVPLSKTSAEKIDALRAWAKGRARFASTPEVASASTRTLDL